MLAVIEARYGVSADILLGVWALESDFGAGQGEDDVIRSLATLAADGRRRAWAEGELYAALRIIATRQAPRERLKGSWAGAMGQTQLEPSVFLSRAVDVDGDGRADIWDSAPDALGSAANILAQAGWVTGAGWAREVLAPPGFDYALAEGPRELPSWWADKGVVRADGAAWSDVDAASPCGLIVPAGAAGPAFLVLPNHFVIRAYNNSTSYALAVGLIADAVAGAGALKVPLAGGAALVPRRARGRPAGPGGARPRRRRDRRGHRPEDPRGPPRLAGGAQAAGRRPPDPRPRRPAPVRGGGKMRGGQPPPSIVYPRFI